MARKVFQKTDGPFGAFKRHLGPKLRWIGFFAAEICDALPDQRRRSVQAAQKIARQIVGCADGKNIYRIDRRIGVRPLEPVIFLGMLVALNRKFTFEQRVIDFLIRIQISSGNSPELVPATLRQIFSQLDKSHRNNR